MPQYHVVPGKSVFQPQPMTLLFGHPATLVAPVSSPKTSLSPSIVGTSPSPFVPTTRKKCRNLLTS